MRYPITVAGWILAFSAMLQADEKRPGPAFDPNELRGFVDGVMEAQQKAHHFAGAVIVVVHGGTVILQKGYGYADFDNRVPVYPERTLFRIASNSKMFVWTAVMQLVEAGRLDLHTDVNKYLKGFQIPATFPQAITMEHLMTHTAGFEDRVIGLFAKSADEVRPIAELMRTQMPRRVFPPGQVAAYSNYGTTLAALIVEQVSGIAYDRYLTEKILKPLGMTHATLSQPVSKDLAGDQSQGYQWTAGKLKKHPFEYVPWAPCGAMSVSGADMARFMIAYLNDGTFGKAQILRPETVRLVRTPLLSPYPSETGLLHGFFPMDWNGEKIYGHGGDTMWFHSLTAMLPERGLGVFAAYNTDSGSKARTEFLPAFFDHYFPKPMPKEFPAPKDKRTQLARFAGVYFPARSSFSDASTLNRMMSAVTLSIDSDGYLNSKSQGDTFRWRQVEPLAFQQVDGKQRIVFRENGRGEIADYCSSPLCIVTMQKQPRWEIPWVQLSGLGVCLAILLGGSVGIPISAILRRKQFRPGLSKLARLLGWLNCLAWVVGFGILTAGMQNGQRIVFGPTAGLKLTYIIWRVAAVLTLVALPFCILAWRRSWWQTTGRVMFTLMILGAAGCFLWLSHWNLLG